MCKSFGIHAFMHIFIMVCQKSLSTWKHSIPDCLKNFHLWWRKLTRRHIFLSASVLHIDVDRRAQPFCLPAFTHSASGSNTTAAAAHGGQGNPLPPPPQNNMHPSYWNLFFSPLEGRIDFDKALHTGIMLLSRPNLFHI